MLKKTGVGRQSADAGWLIHRAAEWVAILGGLYFLAAFLYIALSRLGYPFALEWLEGGSYAQVQRLLTGQPLYEQPSMEYVAMIYPPLYYYAAALVARALGLTFMALRLISLTSSLGALILIFLIVRQGGGRTLAALLASSLFAASYHISGSWFDIARVDMLSVLLVLLGLWLLGLGARPYHFAAGIFFAAACLTKQTHLITLACLIGYAVIFDRSKLLTFVPSCLAALGFAYLVLDQLYDGWFGFFALKLALGSGEYVTFASASFGRTAMDFWLNSILLALPLIVVLATFHVITGLRSESTRRSTAFYLAITAGMLGTSWSVVQVGGYKNDLVPAYAALSVLFGISFSWWLDRFASRATLQTALLAAYAMQLALLWYPISDELPSKTDLAAGRSIVQRIQSTPGEVYVPFHPDLVLMAGKWPYASWSPMYQLEGNYGGGDIRLAGRVKTAFSRAIERRQFDLIILDQDPNWIWGDPERFYTRLDQPVFADEHVFWPVTGWQTRPESIWVPAAE